MQSKIGDINTFHLLLTAFLNTNGDNLSIINPDLMLQSDMGKEYYNKYLEKVMAKYEINHYSTCSTMKD